MISDAFPGRVGLQQRVIPGYRALFLDTLAERCLGGLSVFAGQPLLNEGIHPAENLKIAQLVQGNNRYFFNPASPLFLCWQSGFINWLEKWQPEVLIVEANPRYLATRQAVAWMHQRERKVVGWGLGAPVITGPLAGLRRWERSSFVGSLDAIVAYSQSGAAQYRAMGYPAQKVYVAFNAVESAPHAALPERSIDYKERSKVLFIGRLQTRKRVDLLLQACASLTSEQQPKLVIVGDGPARLELENMAKQIYPQAEFVGAKQGAELEPHFAKADLFILPGTGGLAIQQAMAHGLPVIVAQGDGTQDDLVRNDNGWQIPPDDLPALTEILRRALSDRARLREMGKASYRIVAEEINVEKMAGTFLLVLNRLTGH